MYFNYLYFNYFTTLTSPGYNIKLMAYTLFTKRENQLLLSLERDIVLPFSSVRPTCSRPPGILVLNLQN